MIIDFAVGVATGALIVGAVSFVLYRRATLPELRPGVAVPFRTHGGHTVSFVLVEYAQEMNQPSRVLLMDQTVLMRDRVIPMYGSRTNGP